MGLAPLLALVDREQLSLDPLALLIHVPPAGREHLSLHPLFPVGLDFHRFHPVHRCLVALTIHAALADQ